MDQGNDRQLVLASSNPRPSEVTGFDRGTATVSLTDRDTKARS